ncbi:MAG: phosphatidylserine decarboxylase [Devosiaceae bacterium]|nr:phosphatidylserine decarboxylase [Devosiaceae bacterium MH13]
MSLLQSVRTAIPPINPAGYPFIAVFALASLALSWLSTSLFWIGVGLTLWCVLFFRDPKRITPQDENLVIAPADGRICFVGHRRPPPELMLGDQPMRMVGIFMNVFDVHVNRAPVTGRIERIAYKPGAFVSADLDKASEANERNGFVFETPHGPLAAVQIAGLVARRILTWGEEAQQVQAGERIGMIRFGSRVDVYLPDVAQVVVGMDQRTVAGETIIAQYGSDGRLDRSVPLRFRED